MARTPIPPSARAARNSSTSARRKRCAMLTFSCFLFLTTGFAEVVLTDCTHQRYPIARRKATPPQRLAARLPKTRRRPSLTCSRPYSQVPTPPEPLAGRDTQWRVYCGILGDVLYTHLNLLNFRSLWCFWS